MPKMSARITPLAATVSCGRPTSEQIINGLPQSSTRDHYTCLLASEAHAARPVTALATSNGLLYSACHANAGLESWAELGLTDAPISTPMTACPPTSAVAVGGSKWVATAHKDLKIRLWSPTSASGGQLHQVASLPSLRQFLHNWTLQHRYVQTRRHGKRRAWMQHSDTISALAFSADLTLLYSASWDRTVKVWSLEADQGHMRCQESFNAHIDSINAMLVGDSDGLLYTGSADKSIKVWSRRPTSTGVSGGGGRSRKCKHSMVVALQEQGAAVNTLVLNRDGSLLYSGGSDGKILVWRRSSPSWPHKAAPAAELLKVQEKLQGHARAVLCLDMLHAEGGGMLVSGSADKTIRLWRQHQHTSTFSASDAGHQALHHECVAVVRGHAAPVRSLRVSVVEELSGVCAGVAFSGGLDGSIKMWILLSKTTNSTAHATAGADKVGGLLVMS